MDLVTKSVYKMRSSLILVVSTHHVSSSVENFKELFVVDVAFHRSSVGAKYSHDLRRGKNAFSYFKHNVSKVFFSQMSTLTVIETSKLIFKLNSQIFI